MSNHSIDDKLRNFLREESEKSNSHKIPLRENRIFTNRNLKLARIQAVGFDMDYTLAQYQQEALDKLTMRLSLQTLVRDEGYPESILDIPYEGAFTIRGLVMDTELGNVLKMDKFRYVSLAYHGLKPLDSSTRSELYNKDRISLTSSRYRAVDTLFEILEAYLYAALIDHLETGQDSPLDYQKLFKDLRGAIDLCHRDGSMKNEIMAHPEIYIQDDPLLIPTLHMMKEDGKKLFVLTNSEAEYTDFMLSWLFRHAEPFFKNWRNCFDIVAAFARKPSFFNDGHPLKIIEEQPSLFFSGGNLSFLEEKLQTENDQVLYVGDHIYGDILKSKHNTSWRTCMIVPELDFQIKAEQEAKPFLKELRQNESRRKQITMDINWRRNHIYELQQFKEVEADELDLKHLQTIDKHITESNRKIEGYHAELSELVFQSRQLRRNISGSFNCYWGRLFKTGGQLSIFAEQIRDYACIYTSQVSNFSYYGVKSYMENMATPMPHEDHLFTVRDLDFDVSMEEDGKVEGPTPQIIEKAG